MKRICTFMIALILMAGMLSCGEVIDNGDGNGNGNGNGTVSHQLTVSSTSGGSVVEPGEGVHIYEEGTVVELEAVADDGHRFVDWTGDVATIADVNTDSTTITMQGDYSITANFEEIPAIQYELTISSTAGGSVTTPGEGTFVYNEGTVVDIVAARASGYRFSGWTGDVDHVAKWDAASTTIIMNSHYSIVAGFVETVEIRDWYDLDAIRHNLNGDYLLVNDIDSTTAGYSELASAGANSRSGWRPIGGDRIGEGHPFIGSFNGQGHEIRDLYIDRPNEGFVALFGSVGEGGGIRYLGVVNAAITGGSNVGSLVGENGGSLSGSYCCSSIISGAAVGGLIGVELGQGTVSNSYYNYDEVLINGQSTITIGALSDQDFEQWLANDRFLDINERLSQESGRYLIDNVSDLKQLLIFGQDCSLSFTLQSDLDLGSETGFYVPYLAGEFHGNNHRVLNLNINSGLVSHVGLFGRLAPGGQVNAVIVEDVDLFGYWYVGGLVGANSGTVSNSRATGSGVGWI